MNFMMSGSQNHSDEIPAAQTPSEVNIHLGYIRRDIQNLQQETKQALEGIGKKIDSLDDHYITESEFRPVSDQTKASALELKALTEWRDTFNGKMIGLGIAISFASAALTFIINKFF